MKPVLAIPFHDPEKRYGTHLWQVLPQLKTLFARIYLDITPPTLAAQPETIRLLQADPFFRLSFSLPDSQVGDHCLAAYRRAAQESAPDQVVHMAYIDRLVFILLGPYAETFCEDIRKLSPDQAPVLYMRSESAWSTHPKNYYECEMMDTLAGELLFRRTLDFCWCHCAATARQLRPVLDHIYSHDFGVQAELALLLREQLTTRQVNWLSWEDPFLLGRDPQELKAERENSLEETRKRLGYVIPIMQVLLGYSKGGTHEKI